MSDQYSVLGKASGTEELKNPAPILGKYFGRCNIAFEVLTSIIGFSKIPSELTDKSENLLKFVGLYQKRKLRAGDLSFGQQKLLELAMALMNEPKMLLLDEPTAGINPTLINGIIDRLIKVNKEFGITLLVIEHNMRVIMQLAQKIFCLAHGEMLAEGTPEQIKNDKRVIDAYLGAQ